MIYDGSQHVVQDFGGTGKPGQTQMCLWLAITGGDKGAALTLKTRCAPAATALARQWGSGVDFAGATTPADIEALIAYVALTGTSLSVLNVQDPSRPSVVKLTRRRAPGQAHITLRLYKDHYTRLVRYQFLM